MLSFLKNSFLNEYNRWVLWLPVFQAAGIIAYFSMPAEPSRYAVAGALAAAIILCKVFWRKSLWRIVFIAVLTFMIGFSCAKIRAEYVNAPAIYGELYVRLNATVEEISYVENHPRLLLSDLKIERLPEHRIPEKIRLTIRTKFPADLQPNDRIATHAVLLEPPKPVLPNAYDFSRWAYFQQIGATGFAVKPIEKIEQTEPTSWLNELRYQITKFILSNSEGQAGAITAALITGERSQISNDVNDAMRNSGLAHILSISGLHMSLVCGFFFVLVRYGLGLIGGLSQRVNIKKLAAFISIIGSFCYLLISGMPSPATRSFLMIFLLLLAIIIDRTPTPMRSVGFAAFLIMLFTPEEVLNPGFQMSFMAVIALVAIYETLMKRNSKLLSYFGESKLMKFLHLAITYPLMITLTSLFAGLATTPFAAYHFNQYAVYGLIANLLAMPLSSFWIMPMAVFALILAPFGLAGEAIQFMSLGVEQLINIAFFVSSLEGASGVWKSFSAINLCLIAFGMLWLMIWQTRWRIAGALPIAIGLFFASQTPTPDIIIGEKGKLWAINFPDGLKISNRRKTFASEQWYKSLGQQYFQALPKQDIYELRGKTISLNCKDADLIFDVVKPRKNSKAYALYKECEKQLFVDSNALEKLGTHTIYIDDSNIWTENVQSSRGHRLWTK